MLWNKKSASWPAVAAGAGLLVAALIIAAMFSAAQDVSQKTDPEGPSITVHKSPTCGCCANYVAYLRQQGYKVDVKETNNLDSIKEQYGLPAGLQSCHTAVIDGYVVEGHMPVEAIRKLISERPALRGIALPGMPQGSPGMPGVKRGMFSIMGFDESGAHSSFMDL